jgi:hypothetical protein
MNTGNGKKIADRKANSSVLAMKITALYLSLALGISVIFTVVNLINLTDITGKNLLKWRGFFIICCLPYWLLYK